MSHYKLGEASTHRLTLDEKYLPSPSAAASLWAALWKVGSGGGGVARGTEIQRPTSVAEKIYPLENVGYHCRDPPLNGFQLCRNCCQGDWSGCLSCRDHLVGRLTPTRGPALSYGFPHPIYPGAIITNMQSNIQKTWSCPLMIDSQSGRLSLTISSQRKCQRLSLELGLLARDAVNCSWSCSPFLGSPIALIISTTQFSPWLHTVSYCSLIVSPPR